MRDLTMWNLIMAGAVGLIMAGAVGYIVYTLWLEYKRRKLSDQIRKGEVPVDYSQVAKRSQELNNQVELGNPTFRQNVNDLTHLRERVGLIRLSGYDRAISDRNKGLKFSVGVAATPYPKGSGEAKQWVRGYCQGRNVRPPGPYMRKA